MKELNPWRRYKDNTWRMQRGVYELVVYGKTLHASSQYTWTLFTEGKLFRNGVADTLGRAKRGVYERWERETQPRMFKLRPSKKWLREAAEAEEGFDITICPPKDRK